MLNSVCHTVKPCELRGLLILRTKILPPSTPPQVAKGLAYLHEYKIVYYDLKSPNVLVFQFPSPQQSLQQTSQQVHTATRVEYFTRVFVCAPA